MIHHLASCGHSLDYKYHSYQLILKVDSCKSDIKKKLNSFPIFQYNELTIALFYLSRKVKKYSLRLKNWTHLQPSKRKYILR